MANIFLDTNFFIDLIARRTEEIEKEIENHKIYISPLSIHILFYVIKINVPNKIGENILKSCLLVIFDKAITTLALAGPTRDFEDNIQLHSAAQADCSVFLTNDQKLLDMKFFGKTRIVKSL